MSLFLNFNCPHCNHEYIDELEVLDIDVLHDFKCENCDLPFVMLYKECETCSEETVFVWKEVPSLRLLPALQCGSCFKVFHKVNDEQSQLITAVL